MEWREGESEKEIHRGGAEGESAREGAKTPSDTFCQWKAEERIGGDSGSGVPPDVVQASRLMKS